MHDEKGTVIYTIRCENAQEEILSSFVFTDTARPLTPDFVTEKMKGVAIKKFKQNSLVDVIKYDAVTLLEGTMDSGCFQRTDKIVPWKEVIDNMDLCNIGFLDLEDLIFVMECLTGPEEERFNMSCWQYSASEIIETDTELVEDEQCTVCLGGWLGVSPEFRTRGGTINILTGSPCINNLEGHHAVQFFLTRKGIDYSLENRQHLGYCLTIDYSILYNTSPQVSDVLRRLYYVRDKVYALLK